MDQSRHYIERGDYSIFSAPCKLRHLIIRTSIQSQQGLRKFQWVRARRKPSAGLFEITQIASSRARSRGLSNSLAIFRARGPVPSLREQFF